MNVSFTSDYNIRWSGFRLDIQSISCQDDKNYLTTNLGCDEQEVQLSTGEVQHGALASETVNFGFYPNYACQNWNIITDENEVYIKATIICFQYSCMSKPNIL